ncbi:MAG: hypothetical protein ABGX15_02150 [Paracoccaceae bacterium]
MLYVNAPTGVDALSMTVVVPQGTGYVNRHPWNQIEMQGLTFEFMGLVMNDCSRYLLEGVTVIGAPTDGLSLDYTCGVDRFCTVIGSSNDNWNIHGNVDGSTDATGRPSLDNFQVSEEMCSILAWDDGHSAHERSAVTLRGGIIELCGSTACAPASGAEVTAYHVTIADNGWRSDAEQSGVAVLNGPEDDGEGTIFEGHNLILRGNPRGVSCFGGTGEQKATLYNCMTFDCSEAALYAIPGGRIDSYGLVDSGSTARTAGLGTINDN